MRTHIIDFKYGRIMLLRGDLISYIINLNGEWADSEVALLSSILRPGDTVIEVGSNIGSHAIPIAKMIGDSGRLFCFEPQRIIYQILCGNLALNNATNCFAFNHAIGDVEKEVYIPNYDYSQSLQPITNFGSHSFLNDVSSGERCRQVRLDDFYFEGGLDALKMIKIDVEGMELHVLDGAQSIIQKHRPLIFLEANTNRKNIYDRLTKFGYNCYWFCDAYFSEKNFFRNRVNIMGSDGDSNWLCVPREAAKQPTFLELVVDDEHSMNFTKSEGKYRDLSGIIDRSWLNS